MSDDNDNFRCGASLQDDVHINGFMFCADHGMECCHICCTDHRATNNMQIEDDLTEEQWEAITDFGLLDLEDRQPLSVAGLWKRVQGNRAACTRHSKIGCSSCFDFKQQLLQRLLPASAATGLGSSSNTAASGQQPQSATAGAGSAAAAAAGTAAGQQHAAAGTQSSSKCWGCGARKGSQAAAGGASVSLKKCSGCKRAKYCCRECQVADYAAHKAQCKQWAQELLAQ